MKKETLTKSEQELVDDICIILRKYRSLGVIRLAELMNKAIPCIMHYVYIVKCDDGTYYTGYTDNVPRRIEEHNNSEGAKYTRSRRPVKLVYNEAYITKSTALKRECFIKKLSRKQKIKLFRLE
jgi:putative endonuclease